MNKQQLASKIWASANKMRSKIEASEYKDYILGFIFYKFLSEKEERTLFKDGWSKDDLKDLSETDSDTVEYIQKNIGYFISYENLFSTWISQGSDFDVSNVTDALSAFDRLIYTKKDENDKTIIDYRPVFKDIFKTLQTGLDKLGENSGARTKAIRGLIDLIKDIPMDDKQDYDVLGFIYEYLISNFAANAGKKAGEFYTPHEVSLLMSEIVANHLKNRDEIEIYDPTSGSGSLLINIGKCMAKQMKDSNRIKYYAQELKENTYNLTRMNLVMRGIEPSNIVTRCGDTLDKDWPYFDDSHAYKALYVDAVVSNPPYSQNWDPASHQGDVRYANFGYAPKSKADYAFLLHDLYHVKPDGIMTIVLPHGVLFRGGEEENIRTQLIENDHIETIIGLPANIFFGTGIPTIIMVLRQKRDDNNVLFIDASKHFIKDGKNNKLQASDIRRIMDSIVERRNDPKFDKFSRLVSKEEIRANGYNLNIPRYVDSSEEPEAYDLYATMYGGIPNSEIEKLSGYFKVFPTLKGELFREEPSKPYSTLVSENVEEIIESNDDVKGFKTKYAELFSGLAGFLRDELVTNPMGVTIYREENAIADYIFDKLAHATIIDKYEAYQLLDDSYKGISQDLEIIQTEGLQSIKKVDPRRVTVTKKKDNKEEKIQDGWIGRILPFELVQKELLGERLREIQRLQDTLNDISSQYSEILESMSEDDKETAKDCINEEGDAFVPKEVKSYVKSLLKSKAICSAESVDGIMLRVNSLIDEEKTAKSALKKKTAELEELTKTTIENLTDEQALELLDKKWSSPIVNGIMGLANGLLRNFMQKVVKLSKKYEYTMLDTNDEIEKNESELSSLLEGLEGDSFDMKAIDELKKMLGGGSND